LNKEQKPRMRRTELGNLNCSLKNWVLTIMISSVNNDFISLSRCEFLFKYPMRYHYSVMGPKYPIFSP